MNSPCMPIESCHVAIRRANIILGTYQRHMANLMLSLNVLYLAYQTQQRSLVLNQIQ